ncbi:MAG: hypothetical protein JXB32_25630 [Deltaproteobacteria bacterium]|nr:hypothetical protein [Deltaproteobacteria bacterium]
MKRANDSRGIRAAAVVVAAVAVCAVGTSALGCSAATIGLGSVGLGVGALVAYLLLAVGGGTACSSRGPVGACLSIAAPPSEDVVEPPGPCLQPPYPYPPIEPCLEYVPVEPSAQECLSIAPTPCLSMSVQPPPEPPFEPCLEPPEDDASPYVHICLSDMLIEGEVVRPGEKAAPDAPRAEASSGRHLAAAGVLTEDQLRRLARLRGES